MRSISPALKAEFESGTPRIARLVKVDCKNGTQYAFTDHDLPLTVDGVLYTPTAGLQQIKYTATANNDVSNQKVAAAWLEVQEDDLRGGVFDSAEIEAAWCSWANPGAGRIVVFLGEIGSVEWSEIGFEADIVSFTKRLERIVGWVYTANCRHELYGTAAPGKLGFCGVNPATYTFTGAITSIETQKWRFTTNLAQPDGYFSNGILTFTSGNNAGLSVTIKKQVGAGFEVFLPTAFILTVGDTFSVRAGCDLTLDTCRTKFNNVNNFGGFPHIQQDVSFR